MNKKVILTAAHCIQDKVDVNPRQAEQCNIVVGKQYLNSYYERYYQQFLIREFKIHPSWNRKRLSYDGDIAMVILETPITFKPNIKPICLPAKKHSSADVIGKCWNVAGWGYTSAKKTTTGIPKILQVTIASEEDCLNSETYVELYMGHRSFCSTPDIGRSPCKGNST